MSFKILIHDDISLASLIEINKNEGRVLKTPHIGNIYPNNLAFIALGFPTLLYDRTIGSKDKSFYPHKIIYNGIAEQIADPSILSTHNKLNSQSKNFVLENDFSGKKITDMHLSVLRQALPQGNFFTYTHYLKDNAEIVSKIVKAIVQNFPKIWYRFVNENGVIQKVVNPTPEQILSKGIMGIDHDFSGFLIPNPVNILLHGTADVLKSNIKDIYLLSGPDMYVYMKDYEEVLNNMYNCIKNSLNLNLPSSVNCHIIPVMKMRFIVTKDDKGILDELMILYDDYMSADTATRNLLDHSSEHALIQSEIDKKNITKAKIITHMQKNHFALERTMFYDVSKSNCFTQYDLVMSNGLYIHPWAIVNKLSDVSSAFTFLDRCFRTIKDF